MDASELVQEYFRRTTTHRTDLDALAEFMETRMELPRFGGQSMVRHAEC